MRRSHLSSSLAIVAVAACSALLPVLPVPFAFANSVTDIIGKVTSWVRAIVTALALLTIIVAGLRLVASQGDEGQKETAKKAIIYAIVGIVVVSIADMLANLGLEIVGGG